MPQPSPIFFMFLTTATTVLLLVGWRWYKVSRLLEEADDEA